MLPRLDIANDRQLYLALIGPALLLARTIGTRLPARAAAGLVSVLCVVLAAATVARNADYRNEISLWQATVEASPNKARAWNNLGYAHRLAGDADAARAAFVRALQIDPGFARAS